MMVRSVSIFLAILAAASGVFGQAQSARGSSAASPAVFPLSDLKEGMHGVARTVFQGSEPEEFGVEILGVVPGGVGPKQDLIIGRLTGGSTVRTSVFAGMSGSPVYIDGKLVGAISYSFPFAKEPICGITPIEQMIAIFEKKEPARAVNTEPRAYSFTQMASAEFTPMSAAALSGSTGRVSDPTLAAVSGGTFQPIAAPVTFSGFSQRTLEEFGPMLTQAGLMPVSAAGGSSPIVPLKRSNEKTLLGGASVTMQLARGDYGMAASGTVTMRDGEKIYAFGHPFLSLGTSDLPMAESHVITVIPNVNNSFKVAVPDSMVGSMTQDRATGVFGKLDQAPKMVEVEINLTTSRGQDRKLNFEVARDDSLTPILLNMAVNDAIASNERSLGDLTVELSGEIPVSKHEPIKLDRRFAGSRSVQFAANSVAIPVSQLLNGNFEDLDIGKISLNIRSIDGAKNASLDRISVDKMQARPGDIVNVSAYARTESGRLFVQNIPLKIPDGISSGPISIIVGDGPSVQQNAPVRQFVPKDVSEFISTINSLKTADRLYAQIVRNTNGAVVGVSEMPNLPPSVLATLNNDRTAGGFKSSGQTVIAEQEIAPAEFIVSGQQSITIQIVN